jgi:hypothetical protein
MIATIIYFLILIKFLFKLNEKKIKFLHPHLFQCEIK